MRRLLIPGALAAVVLILAITLSLNLKNAFVSTGTMDLAIYAVGSEFVTYISNRYDVPLNKTVRELVGGRTNVTLFGMYIVPVDGWRPGYTYVITTSAMVDPLYVNCTYGYFAMVQIGNKVYLIANETMTESSPWVGIRRGDRGYLDNEWVYINIALPPPGWEKLPLCTRS